MYREILEKIKCKIDIYDVSENKKYFLNIIDKIGDSEKVKEGNEIGKILDIPANIGICRPIQYVKDLINK